MQSSSSSDVSEPGFASPTHDGKRSTRSRTVHRIDDHPQDADIEYLVHSGKFFGGASRSSSAERSSSPGISFARSPSPESESVLCADDEDDDEGGRRHVRGHGEVRTHDLGRRGGAGDDNDGDGGREYIGMGPGRTGVKGVIRDQRESEQIKAARRQKDMDELRRRMERAGLGSGVGGVSKTWLEGQGKDDDDDDENEERKGGGQQFGHLREVGKAGFVSAVEREERGVWVVVHLYDPSLERCYELDDTLTRLARRHGQIKFLRARASALGFASKRRVRRSMPGRYTDEDDDLFHDDDHDDAYDDEDDEVEVDTDVLPTLLVYRDGDLVFNWVRVDWEAGEAGVEELLARCVSRVLRPLR